MLGPCNGLGPNLAPDPSDTLLRRNWEKLGKIMNDDDVQIHVLQIRQQELLDELDDLEQAANALAALAMDAEESDGNEKRQERLAWLSRQQAGVLVILSETERALLAFAGSAT